MARIIGIDYGTKRTGIAVSDPLQIIASGLDTIPTHQVLDFLTRYMAEEEVEIIVVGEPKYPDGSPAQIAHLVVGFVRQLQRAFPQVKIAMQDERFTSEEAKDVIRQVGVGKQKRRDKSLVDKVSATIILQNFMEKHRYSLNR
ncbi:MAG TPA: Holliday junction resolvase RuvX [Saprospiraceae bacterium]|nr:Holliday junction resolvase RuvX [Saprospiraceae bacterium]HRK82684.1 Holliday junction resolvase RuvX [Saprospiraceae bacterium]